MSNQLEEDIDEMSDYSEDDELYDLDCEECGEDPDCNSCKLYNLGRPLPKYKCKYCGKEYTLDYAAYSTYICPDCDEELNKE